MKQNFKFALFDEEGNVVRFVSSETQGALPYPPLLQQLDKDDAEWHEPLFQESVMDKNILAIMCGILAALVINSFVLYHAKTNESVECYFETKTGKEIYVKAGYRKQPSTLYAWRNRSD